VLRTTAAIADHGGGRQVVLGWTGKQARPVLAGASATWPDVSAGVDYRVTALRSGFESFLKAGDFKCLSRSGGTCQQSQVSSLFARPIVILLGA